MAKEPRLSMATIKVLGAFLEQGPSQFSGAEISKKTGQASGTLYPILMRLETAGWLESRWEDGDPSLLGRPRRRLYRITALGQSKVMAVRQTLEVAFGGPAWA